MFAALLLLAAAQPAAAPPAAAPPADAPQEIVVTARRSGKCSIAVADRALSERQFEQHAGEWGRLGRAIRVVHPRGASYACLARIAFRLNRHGIRLIHFVERAPTRR